MINRLLISTLTIVCVSIAGTGIVLAQDDFLFELNEQKINNTGASIDWPENYIFRQSIYPMTYPNGNVENSIEYYVHDSALNTYVQHAKSSWENIFPSWSTGFVATSQSDADLQIYKTACPLNAIYSGCVTAHEWGGTSGPNVNLVTKADLYMKLESHYSEAWRRAVMAHEFGHILGLAHHVPSSGCSSTNTVMGSFYVSGGSLYPCYNTETPTAYDIANINDYYKEGIYLRNDPENAFMSGPKMVTQWSDWAWAERGGEVRFYWHDGNQYHEFHRTWLSNHGAHRNAAAGSDRILVANSYPASSGVPSGKQMLGCAISFYGWNNGATNFSTNPTQWVCSSPVTSP